MVGLGGGPIVWQDDLVDDTVTKRPGNLYGNCMEGYIRLPSTDDHAMQTLNSQVGASTPAEIN